MSSVGKGYVVASVPTDNETKTNYVYVDMKAIREWEDGAVVKISGYPFMIKGDNRIPDGHIAMNVIQRRLLSLSTTAGSVVHLAKMTDATPPLSQISLKVEHVIASKTGGTLDCGDFSVYVHVQFFGQCFRTGQQFAAVLNNGMRLVVTVEKMLLSDGSTPSNEVVASLTESTAVLVTAGERSGITLANISDKQLDTLQRPIMQDFDLAKMGIGGLREQFGQVFRRAFASRVYPTSVIKKLNIKHVKGVLLYGPPGTGKTLIARKIGEMLNCHEPKIVNGPEVFNKFVGGTEENIRALFADAEAEEAAKGDQSQLHLVIFDEFDAICKQRGAVRDSTGVNDNVVNQLLSKIDGVNPLNNILLIGLTNRLDLIDEAVLRPGRFEVHIEIGLPDEPGRLEIFKIHTRGMRENNMMSNDVSLENLAAETRNYSGAEIEGVVRAATSNAFYRNINMDNMSAPVNTADLIVTLQDFEAAVKEVRPAFGGGEEECKKLKREDLIRYGPAWDAVEHDLFVGVTLLKEEGTNINLVSKLLHGQPGTGKSAVAAYIAEEMQYPFVKVISSKDMIGFSDIQKGNLIRKTFEDAYKSPKSCIILDDLERLIEFSELGGRYSNAVLQALLVLIKTPPPPERKLLVIATTSRYETMRDLELADCFTTKQELLPVAPTEVVIDAIRKYYSTSVTAGSQLVFVLPPTPIKKLIVGVEMASKFNPMSQKKELNYNAITDAIRSLGIAAPLPPQLRLAP